MRIRCRHTDLAAWLIPMLIAATALALPSVGEAAGTGSIEGTVTAEGGGALEEVRVCAVQVDEEEFECDRTDASGSYEIAGLPVGEYKVVFLPWPLDYARQFYDHKRTWSNATIVSVVSGPTQTGIDAVLEKGATVSGVVSAAATGDPVEAVVACAEDLAEEEFECAETDATGSYAIEGLGSGEFEIYFYTYYTGQNLLSQPYAGGLVSVTAGAEAGGIDAALEPGGEIAGTVRAAATGAPVSGVKVCLTESAFYRGSVGCATTGSGGAYRFDQVWTDGFKVVFSSAPSEDIDEEAEVDPYLTQWWNGEPTWATATPVSVVAPATVGGIDGSLIATPTKTKSSSTGTSTAGGANGPTPSVTVVKPKSILKCRRGLAKRKVRGELRCVKLHNVRRHHRHHKKSA